MDRNFHTDDFERLLRERSNEFRMYPSKRIWHSIYNNIHPGRKWPSVAMSITLISALLFMGYLNTKNTYFYTGSGKITSQQKIVALTNTPRFVSQTLIDDPTGSIKSKITGTIPDSKPGTASNIGLKINTLVNQLPASSPVAMQFAIRQPSFTEDIKYPNNGIIAGNNQTKKEIIDPFSSRINSIPGTKN
ncbi:MAG: hypothetical protein ABI760_05870, partial [Ferruginibacter sp.]